MSALARKIWDCLRKRVEARAKEALEHVGLGPDFYKKSPFELSGGQKTKSSYCGNSGDGAGSDRFWMNQPQDWIPKDVMKSWIRWQNFIR